MTTLNGIPFYSWDSLETALKNKGVQENQINKIKLIFQEVDKYDENNNEVQGGDRKLNNNERLTFFDKLHNISDAILNKFKDKAKEDFTKMPYSELVKEYEQFQEYQKDSDAVDRARDWMFTEYVEKHAGDYLLLITYSIEDKMFDKIPQYVEEMESVFTTDNPETQAQVEWMVAIKKGKEFCSTDKTQE